jgi:2'-5' RNA ligase
LDLCKALGGIIMRGFIAIETDKHFQTECETIQSQLKSMNIQGIYMKSEDIHLTLKFFHNIDEESIKVIMGELKEKIHEKSFPIELHRLMAFIKRGKTSIVWLDVDKNIAKVKHLAEITNDVTNKYSTDEHPDNKFKAHYTLLRTRLNLEEEKILPEKLSEIDVNIKTKVSGIAFYKSELTAKGSVFTKLFRFDL